MCISAFLPQTGILMNAAAIDHSPLSLFCNIHSPLPQAVSNRAVSTLIPSLVVTVPCA